MILQVVNAKYGPVRDVGTVDDFFRDLRARGLSLPERIHEHRDGWRDEDGEMILRRVLPREDVTDEKPQLRASLRGHAIWY